MSKIVDFIFVRNKHVCPWWLCFIFDNILRKLIHDPLKILQPYIKTGDVVLDIGPGMGYFTIPMTEMVGENGSVVAADIQEKMLLALKIRAEHAGVNKRIILHLSSPNSMGVQEKVNFVLAFWMVHEVPDKKRFLNELFSVLKDNGTFLLAEPFVHVTESDFEETVKSALQAGFTLSSRPKIVFSRAALLVKLAENERSEI